ncbi:hypothetical protein Tco_1466228 [Tanacetum coccineum]
MTVLSPKITAGLLRMSRNVMSKTDVSVKSKGNLNRECAVRPAGNNKDATPDEATANTIFPSARNVYQRILFFRKQLPVVALFFHKQPIP